MSDNACCCCDIKSGVLAAGVYHSVQSLIGCYICANVAISLTYGAFVDGQALGAFFLSLCIAFNIELIASVCLIIGVLQYKRELVTAWIAANMFLLLGYLIMWIIAFIISAEAPVVQLINGIVGVVGIGVLCYTIFVVWSYRKAADRISLAAVSDPGAELSTQWQQQETLPPAQQWLAPQQAQQPPRNPQWAPVFQQQSAEPRRWHVFGLQQQNSHPQYW